MLKHLPLDLFPDADLKALQAAYEPGDVFDDTCGPGAHLKPGTRKMILTAYRRWLGYLTATHPKELAAAAIPSDRITRPRVRAYVDHLCAEVRPISVAICLEGLFYAARIMAPAKDWRWMASIAAHLRACPMDRFSLLIPGWRTLDRGIELMDTAFTQPKTGHMEREIQYRDGLLLTLLSLWPIRRRSLAALTVSRHLAFDEGGVSILLHPADTKSKRAESCRIDERIVPYLERYLREIRPRLLRGTDHDGLWASYQAGPLTDGRIYGIVRKRTAQGFGKAMGLHDFRRSAATFLATEAPEMVGLIPGVLQHANTEVGEKHYNLARSIGASRRHLAALERARGELRLFAKRDVK